MTKTEAAHEFWNNATLDQRVEIMDKVPYQKSQTKRFRAIIAYIAGNLI